MNRSVRWKLVVILIVVIGASVFAWMPPLAERLGIVSSDFVAERRLRLGLDLQGGVQFVLRVNTGEALAVDRDATHDDVVAQAREAVDRRINALGVVEPVIAVQGSGRDELLIQLPGFTDVERARAILGATARLEWRLENGPHAGTIVSGRDIRRAWTTQDDVGQPAVGFSLAPEAARRFGEVTAANIGRPLVIVLDDKVQSSPVIQDAITGGEGVIRGTFTLAEAADLALLLRAGALPVSMTFLGGEYVGPTLGASAVNAGVMASIGGLALVALFMLVHYRRAGVNAVVSVVINLAMLLGVMASLGAALTLPGIAGLILTIGMGLDSNVLIFERIKEELRAGQSIRRAVRAGFDRVFRTILDTHATSLIAAALLFQFGTGAIRGFATVLSLGLLTNVFTAVFVSRTMFEFTLSRGRTPGFGTLGPSLASRLRVDFMAHRIPALVLSAALVVAGASYTIARGLPLGLDFTGGAAVLAQFDRSAAETEVRRALPRSAMVQRFGAPADRTFQIRVPPASTTDDGEDAAAVAGVTSALSASDLPAARVIGTTTVGPSISRDFQQKAAWAMAGALAGITAYLSARFRPGFAIGAAVATVHDIVVTVAALAVAGYDLDLNVVAALLTVAGYSVNDTIVVFDRVRERLRAIGGATIGSAINAAVTDTLGRTIITSGTTLAAVLALYLFGGAALQAFAFTVLVGIVVGTWSTVFVAAPVAAMLARSGRRA